MEWSTGFDRQKYIVATSVLCAMMVTGCATLRLPRIDPTGERIFLPAPAYTTTTQTDYPFRFFGNSSGPAYRTPPDPPLCPPGIQVSSTPAVVGAVGDITPSTSLRPVRASPIVAFRPIASTRVRRPVAGVWMNAERVVALVDSQVVLRASFYGEREQLLPGKHIEWRLSQESVGHFVAVGDKDQQSSLLADASISRKLTNSFAVARTASTDQVLSGDTQQQADDIYLRTGEAWLALTSSREGISHVSAHAPERQVFNNSQQTTTVHWVDASWTFPSPVTLFGGQSVDLSTAVTKPSNDSPAAGMVVRYEILAGANASFAPSGDHVVEVPVNVQGIALAQLVPNDKRAGVAQVAIHVIQPSTKSTEYTRLMVGQGSTSVTWNAPDLVLRIRGPDVVDLDASMTFRIDVTNEGSIAASNVILHGGVPDGMEFLNSEPPAQIFGDRIQWQLGDLAVGANRVIELNYRAQRVGNYQYTLRAHSTEGAEVEERLQARVIVPALQIEVSGSSIANVGDQVQFRVVARNSSNHKMTNVIVYDRYDAGFSHAQAASPIKRSLGDLGPGEEKQFAVTLTVMEPGLRCHVLELTADGGYENSERVCVQVTPIERQAGMALRVTKTGPQSRRVGEEVDFLIRVINSGNVPLRDIQLLDVYPSSLRATMATRGYVQKEDGGLEWTLNDLGVGQSATYQVRCDCRDVDPRACSQVVVTCSDPNVAEVKEFCMQIQDVHDGNTLSDEEYPPFRLPLEEETAGGETNRSQGNLQLSLTDLGDPVQQGRTVTYLLRVANNRKVSDKNVRIQLQVSAQLELIRSTPVGIARKSSDGHQITIEPINELRPGETVDIRLVVTARRSGQAVLRAEVNSLLTQQPLRDEEKTTIFVE